MNDVMEFLSMVIGFGSAGLTLIGLRYLWNRTSGAGSPSKELDRVREELAELRRDNERMRHQYNDTILGMEAGMRRIESRVDRLSGIDVPMPETPAPRPVERQR